MIIIGIRISQGLEDEPVERINEQFGDQLPPAENRTEALIPGHFVDPAQPRSSSNNNWTKTTRILSIVGGSLMGLCLVVIVALLIRKSRDTGTPIKIELNDINKVCIETLDVMQ